MRKGMCKMMFGYKIKAMRKECVSCVCNGMPKMMCEYKIKAIHKGCISYA